MIFLHLRTSGGRKLRRTSGSFSAQLEACCEFSVFQEAKRALPKNGLEKRMIKGFYLVFVSSAKIVISKISPFKISFVVLVDHVAQRVDERCFALRKKNYYLLNLIPTY